MPGKKALTGGDRVIETERLVIRPWNAQDESWIDSVFRDPEVRHFTGGVLSDEDRATFVARRLDRQTRGELLLEPVVEKTTGQVVGVCGLQVMAPTPIVEIGWMLARAYWGRGFALEAARGVLERGHGERGLTRIVAVVNPANRRSIAVANRLSLRFDRVVRFYKQDLLRYESLR
jgi:RimJ/RimL family protein N-acetyltransferase